MSDFKTPEGFTLVKTEQLNELAKQLTETREAARLQTIALNNAIDVIDFVQNLLPANGEIDVMNLMSLLSDTAKFAPIMGKIKDLNTFKNTYAQNTVRIIGK